MTIKEIISKLNNEDLSIEERKELLKPLHEHAKKVLSSREATICISLAIDLEDMIDEDSFVYYMLKDNSEFPADSIYNNVTESIGNKLSNTAWFEVEIIKD